MGDVGDGHAEDVAAVIVRRRVMLGVHGVVMILGVGRVDGDERHPPPVFAQILAVAERRRPGGIRRGLCVVAEHMRDGMGVDGDQADCALARERAEPLHHAAGRQA